MNRYYVLHHKDGSVRMDWYTFSKLKVDRVMDTLKLNASTVAPHVRRPVTVEGNVKEFI